MPKLTRSLIPLFCILLAPSLAWACGGFFCSQRPVDQSSERIIFAVDEEEQITEMVVQIQYSGEDEDFAWVVPLPAAYLQGTLEVWEQDTLLALDRLTAPSFQPANPDCSNRGGDDEVFGCGGCLTAEEEMVMAPSRGGLEEGNVNILRREDVGPYETVTLSAAEWSGEGPAPEDDATAVVTWLRDNNYNVTDPMIPLVREYMNENMVFFAMRLRREASVNDITPIRMMLPGTTPSIPIRLTQIASEPEMGILVFVFGSGRAVPTEGSGYSLAEVADKDLAFRPFSAQNNYYTEISRAVDRAGGHAFITENARSTDSLGQVTGDTRADQRLASYPFLTRLYTRISPEEMTADPAFRFDSSLPQVAASRDLNYLPSPVTCDGDPVGRSADPCAFIYCGPNGVCGETEDGDPACLCEEGYVARGMIEPDGQPSLRCVPEAPPLTRPDFGAINPCFERQCREGRCKNVAGIPACKCPEGQGGALAPVEIGRADVTCTAATPRPTRSAAEEDNEGGCATWKRPGSPDASQPGRYLPAFLLLAGLLLARRRSARSRSRRQD